MDASGLSARRASGEAAGAFCYLPCSGSTPKGETLTAGLPLQGASRGNGAGLHRSGERRDRRPTLPTCQPGRDTTMKRFKDREEELEAEDSKKRRDQTAANTKISDQAQVLLRELVDYVGPDIQCVATANGVTLGRPGKDQLVINVQEVPKDGRLNIDGWIYKIGNKTYHEDDMQRQVIEWLKGK
jgi:hypothetical protein